MMCYICEICVVEAGNINKNKKMLSKTKKMLSGLFAESRALGKSASLPRAWWSALGKYSSLPRAWWSTLGKYDSLPRAWWSALGKPIFFFEHRLWRKSFFLTILCRRSLSAKKFFADGRSRQRSPSHRYLPPDRYYCAPVCRELLLPRAFTLLSVNVLPKGALGKESFAGRCFADGSLPRAALGK